MLYIFKKNDWNVMDEDADIDVTETTAMSFGCSIINQVFHFSKYEIKCMTIIQKILFALEGVLPLKMSRVLTINEQKTLNLNRYSHFIFGVLLSPSKMALP